ncbi:MAG: hypothetical protein HYX41_04490 [Bdellovibrio sp.]|nr:hypothetical protein [Bdellovibrio sp.]
MELNHSQSELLHDIRERPDELRNLLDQSFNVPRGHHYFDDFPVWNPRFKESSGADLVGVFMKGHLAACAGLRVCDVATLNK